MRNESILAQCGTSLRYVIVSVILFGLLYPLIVTLAAQLLFPFAANGSMLVRGGSTVGSAIVGQAFTSPGYFQGRPSAAGKGYDPTQTGGTNLGPTSKKLIDATRAQIASLRRANPDALSQPPMDLITSSGSGIDPDISPEAAYYQAARIAKARNISLANVRALIAQHIESRTFGILGEPRVNVLVLNLALDDVRSTGGAQAR